jgi:protease YdgD
MLLSAMALAFLSIALSAAAQTQPPPPGIGPHDPRVRENADSGPWRAVGKLQATSGRMHESCTGTLIGPALVLTAAHCVFNRRTGHNFLPESLHFLVGYYGGNYAGHAVGVRLVTGPGYDPLKPQRTLGADWALLTLASPLGAPDRMLPLRREPLAVGTPVMIGGYGLDHPLVLMADPKCRITLHAADPGGRGLLLEDCAATRGDSGAPVLVRDGKGWAVGGVFVAGSARGGVAVPLAGPLAEARRAGALER